MRSLPLRELLGVLVGDLIVAEAQAAKASADFIREAGFIGGDQVSDDWGKLRFVTFSFTIEESDGVKNRTIRAPLLSLLPIPLQQIEQAEYEFFVKINDVKEIDPPPKKNYRLGSEAYGLAQPFVDLMCEIAPYSSEPTSEKKTATPKIHIKLTMGQADLPAGLSSNLRRIEEASGSKTK